jgi:hypothetical protein
VSDSTASGNEGADGARPLRTQDLELLAELGRANEWTRSLLCTLARRGAWLRLHDPERAEALLGAVATWPWYKAGQFVFDLLEWEDFMVDGPHPPEFVGNIDPAVRRLVRLLRGAAAHLDATLPEWEEEAEGSAHPGPRVPVGELPALEPGFYLYPDVVIGILLSVLGGGPAPAASSEDPMDPGTTGGR